MESLPEDSAVMHICDRPSCINPKHLVLGTKEDNRKDMVRKGRQVKGERQHLARLNEQIVKRIRKDKTSNNVVLAKKYGVSPPTIRYARIKSTWKHVG
jgi:hypothetical protein